MKYTIERAHPSDAIELIEFLKTVGKETDNLTFGAEGLPITVEQEEAYLASIESSNDNIMILARDEEGNIVGNASLNRLRRRMHHRAGIAITVLKKHWNQGVGTTLLTSLVSMAKEIGVEIIDLEVRSDNTHAIHVYEKLGFIKVCTYPGYMKINNKLIDCDFMILSL